MLTNKLLTVIVLLLVMTLHGCGAQDPENLNENESPESSIPTSDSNSGDSDTSVEDTPPTISNLPTNLDTYEGNSISIDIQTTGDNLSFQWQKRIDGTWVDISNKTNATLTLSSLEMTDAGLFRVAVSNAAGTIQSNPIELIVKANLSIANDLQDQTAIEGNTAQFVITVEGEGPYYYQWYKGSDELFDDAKYDGAQESQLLVKAVAPSDDGLYSVQVTNNDDQIVQSRNSKLHVNTRVRITTAPSNLILAEGGSGSLSIQATGSGPINYQWQKKFENTWKSVAGATSSTLNFVNATSEDGGEYRCIANNSTKKTTVSRIATVSILSPLQIISQPSDTLGSSHKLVSGSSISLNINASGSNLSYLWRKDGTVISTASTLNLTSVDASDAGNYQCQISNGQLSQPCNTVEIAVITAPTILSGPLNTSAYEGKSASFQVSAAGSPTPTINWYKDGQLLSGEHANTLTLSSTTLESQGTYSCTATNEAGSVTCNNAQLEIKQNVSVTQSPQSQTLTTGTNVTLTSNATGEAPLTYTWFKNESIVKQGINATSLTISNASNADGGTYYVRVNNDGSQATSANAAITVIAPPNVVHEPTDITGYEGSNATFTVEVQSSLALSIQWFKNGAALPNTDTQALSLRAITLGDEGVYSCEATNDAGSVSCGSADLDVKQGVSITQPPQSQTLTVGANTTLTTNATGEPPLNYTWYKNDTVVKQGIDVTSLTISNISDTDGGTYFVRVNNDGSQATSTNAIIAVIAPPTVAHGPADITGYEGSNATFNVEVQSSLALSIQWFKDGAPLSNTNTQALLLNDITLNDLGIYSCEATNDAGTISCGSARLDVKEVVRITKSPSSQVTSSGSDITLTVNATGEAPLTYTWFKNDQVIAQSTDLTSINLNNVSDLDSGVYYVTVSNSGSETSSNDASVSVITPFTASARISWNIPDTRESGGSLSASEIEGYHVYHSPSAIGSYEKIAYSNGSGNTSVEISDLDAGTHYFSVTTLDTYGIESDYSPVIIVHITE